MSGEPEQEDYWYTQSASCVKATWKEYAITPAKATLISLYN